MRYTHTGHPDVVCGSVEEPHLDLRFPCVHRIHPSSSLGRLSSNNLILSTIFFSPPFYFSCLSLSLSLTTSLGRTSLLLDNKVLHTCTPTRINAFFSNLIKIRIYLHTQRSYRRNAPVHKQRFFSLLFFFQNILRTSEKYFIREISRRTVQVCLFFDRATSVLLRLFLNIIVISPTTIFEGEKEKTDVQK